MRKVAMAMKTRLENIGGVIKTFAVLCPADEKMKPKHKNSECTETEGQKS
jgi:hypothetical protein